MLILHSFSSCTASKCVYTIKNNFSYIYLIISKYFAPVPKFMNIFARSERNKYGHCNMNFMNIHYHVFNQDLVLDKRLEFSNNVSNLACFKT